MSDAKLSQFVERQSYRAKVTAILTCCILANVIDNGWSFADDSTDSWSAVAPVVTIESVVNRNVLTASGIRWYDATHLIGTFTGPDSGTSLARTISLDGSLGEPLGNGRLSSISPEGDLLIQQTDRSWVVRTLEVGVATRIEEPANDDRDFISYTTPIWSQDGRYAAIVGYYSPVHLKNPPASTILGGVRIIDVSSQTPLSELAASRITIFDRSTPAVIQRIFVDNLAIPMAWGPGDSLYVSQINFVGRETTTKVLRMQPGKEDVEQVYISAGRFYTMIPAVNPDGTKIALVLDLDNRTWDDFTSVLLIDAKTGKELRRLTTDLPILGGDYTWSLQGDEIYARVRNGGLDQIYVIPLEGEARQITSSGRQHFDINLSSDGRKLAYQTQDGYGRKDIRVLDLENGKENIVFVLDEPSTEFTMGEWHHVRWRSTDGVEPFGFLIFPPDFHPNRLHPMIVDVHGGGEGSSLYLEAPLTLSVTPGPLEWHAWAALGYVVFVPDYRSTGNYGPEVIAARYNSGDIGAIKDIEDIVSGTRFVINQGFVDPSRVAILGHSAGGQRVYILLTRHDLYAAAILNESIAPDPTSLFIKHASGENTGGYPAGAYRQMYGGGLAEFPDRYKANYMFDSYRISTPTLILLGNEMLGGIYHVPNEILYSILKQHGIPTRMLKFVEDGHTYSRPESAKLAFEEVRCWLETHMPVR